MNEFCGRICSKNDPQLWKTVINLYTVKAMSFILLNLSEVFVFAAYSFWVLFAYIDWWFWRIRQEIRGGRNCFQLNWIFFRICHTKHLVLRFCSFPSTGSCYHRLATMKVWNFLCFCVIRHFSRYTSNVEVEY